MYFHNICYTKCLANLGTIHSLENISIKLNFHFFFHFVGALQVLEFPPTGNYFDLLTIHSYVTYKTTMNILGLDQLKVAIYMN